MSKKAIITTTLIKSIISTTFLASTSTLRIEKSKFKEEFCGSLKLEMGAIAKT
jgi:hypothetical protein